MVGSCGAYFHIADQVIQMDAYHAHDITAQAKAALSGRPVPALSAPGFHLPVGKRIVDLSGSTQTRKNYRGDGYRQERLKVKRFGKTAFTVGDRELDLRYLEQLVVHISGAIVFRTNPITRNVHLSSRIVSDVTLRHFSKVF